MNRREFLHAGLASGAALALPETLRAAAEVLVHVLPRMSPDGAEAILNTGTYVRSVPRDERSARGHARWVGEDVDGDGACLSIRKADPTG